jgi:hypothetical protein
MYVINLVGVIQLQDPVYFNVLSVKECHLVANIAKGDVLSLDMKFAWFLSSNLTAVSPLGPTISNHIEEFQPLGQ